MASNPEIAALQTYQCHPNGYKFASGLCKPAPGEANIPDAVRVALYLDCIKKGGTDEYTAVPCEHLTDDLAKKLGVCAYGPTHTVFGDAVEFIKEYGDEIVQIAILVV